MSIVVSALRTYMLGITRLEDLSKRCNRKSGGVFLGSVTAGRYRFHFDESVMRSRSSRSTRER